ncbi:MAG TPA: hypothetical protein VH136_18605 [Trebonia sp.]|jgi:hypothetical protein|nr:hypothetical protein [Trebonia sp.]
MEANDGRETTLGAEPGQASAAHGVGPVHGDSGSAPGRRPAERAGARAAGPDGTPGVTLGPLGAFAADVTDGLATGFEAIGDFILGPGWTRWRVIGVLLVLLAAILLAGPLWWLLAVRLTP